MSRVLTFAVVFLAAVLLGGADGSASRAQTPKLFGAIGDGIVLRDASGARVTKLDPGTYDIEVDDRSDFHNFHLQGPGVDETTAVDFIGKVSWTLTFKDGVYMYLCDVHPVSLRGSFTAGTAPSTPPSSPPATGGAVTPKMKLNLTSGPGFTIGLRTAAGKTVRSMNTGTYTVVVRDRSRIHNAHLVGPGYNRATKPLTYTGSQTWKVTLAKVGTLRFLCDPHALQGMKGSAKIVD